MKTMTLILSLLAGFAAQASEVPAETPAPVATPVGIEQEFDGLGGNRILLEKAKALNPETRQTIVQERMVPRRHRLEISPEYSGTFAGDTYSRTQSLGLNLNYHFTPHWSVGVKYNHSFNRLTPEGEKMMNDAYNDYLNNPTSTSRLVPDMDYQKSETLALLSWYPIYGKMNVLDMGVVHFDLYTVAGAGQVELASGRASTATGGLGVGMWLTPNWSSRLEVRYQTHDAQYLDGEKKLDLAVGSFQMGWLL